MVTKYRPEGFGIKELVSKEVYDRIGEEAWNLFSIKTLITLHTLKKLTGWTIIINTWSLKTRKYDGPDGPFKNRGFRDINTTSVGAKNGAHYKGLAFDCDCYKDGKMLSANNVRKFIADNINKFEYIRCLEIDINWVHIDCMGWEDSENRLGINDKNILLYSPKTGSKVINRNELSSYFSKRSVY